MNEKAEADTKPVQDAMGRTFKDAETARYFREKGYLPQTPELDAMMSEYAIKVNAELAPYRTLLDQKLAESNAYFDQLFSRDHEAIGRILKHHLILENCITRFLESVAPKHNWRRAHLRFAQKVAVIPKGRWLIDQFVPGMLEINALRNAIGHQIEAVPSLDALRECVRSLGIVHPYCHVPYTDPVKVVELFTQLVCPYLLFDKQVEEIYKKAHERAGPPPWVTDDGPIDA
jgi:hypothetical protein